MQTKAIRERLMNELNSVLGQHAKIDAHLHNRDREVPGDWPDRAAMMSNGEVLEALDDRQREHIGALKIALERLDAGSYGSCASCGEAIAEARLKALPATSVCVRCA